MIYASGSASVICAVTLLTAGLLKIKDLPSFGQQIAAYKVVPVSIASAAGYLLPLIEIILGGAMLFMPRLGLAAASLFLSFCVAVGLNLLRGRTELRCGCFGSSGKHTISPGHLAGNALLAALAVYSAINAHPLTFIAAQVGISIILLAALMQSLHTMKPGRVADSAERR